MADYTIPEGTTNWDDPYNAAVVDIDARLADVEAAGAGDVASVNGQTGVVTLTTTDVGAAAAVHTHVQTDVAGLTAAIAAAAATGPVSSVASKTGAVTLVATDISNSTAAGRTLVTAADAAAQRTALAVSPTSAISAVGFSGSASDLASGRIPYSRFGSGETITVYYNEGTATWPARPTALTDICVVWTGADEANAPTAGIPGDKWDRPA